MSSTKRMYEAWQRLHAAWEDLGVHTTGMALLEVGNGDRNGYSTFILTRYSDDVHAGNTPLPGYRRPFAPPTMALMLEAALGSAQIIQAARDGR